MKLRYERRQSRWADWCVRLTVFAAVLFVYSALAFRWQYVPVTAFFWLLAIVAVLALLGVVFSVLGFNDLWQRGDRGGARSFWGLVLALIVLAPFIVSGYRAVVYPRLHDISTDVGDPPQFVAAEALRKPPMNPIRPISPAAASLEESAYPDVTGRRYEGSPDRILQAVMAVVDERGWQVTGRRGTPGQDSEIYLEAVAHTFFLAFPVDVVIRLTDEGDTTYVDMRSSSRYALHDFGDNARRIVAFMTALDTQVQGAGISVDQ